VRGEGSDEGELRETIFCVWRENQAVSLLDVGRRSADSEARVSSWITVFHPKGEKGGIE
jgi:hypothetical protein